MPSRHRRGRLHRQQAHHRVVERARIGHFSSDRAVREYAEQIWNVTPTPIEMPSEEIWKAPVAEVQAKPSRKPVKKTTRKKVTRKLAKATKSAY